MREHVFVDESKDRGYYVAAAAVLPSDVTAARRAIRSLVLPGQRRIHFTKESKARRHKILDVIESLEITATVYDAGEIKNQKQARDACLRLMVRDLAQAGAGIVILERDDAAFTTDRKLLFAAVREAGVSLEYRHMRAHEEALLAVPDAFAWCWAKGGEWRARVRERVATRSV